jgi:hypothetical protein
MAYDSFTDNKMKLFDEYNIDYIAIGTVFVSGVIIFFKKLIYDVVFFTIKHTLITKKEKINEEIKDEIKIVSKGVDKRIPKPPKSIREAEILSVLRKNKLKTKKRDLELREAELFILKELYEKEREIDTKLNKLDLKK